MKIYTKTGDEGMTSLFGGGRVPKEARRVSAYGDVDELNAVVGVARLHSDGDLDRLLARIQNELFDVGAELATPEPADGAEFIDDANVTYLENQIDSWERQTTPLRQFVLPGGAPAAAHLHHARTVCRRAERHVWQVAREAEPSCISPAL
ncbi:MAG: cob(I)yrinic acid a,c-diamide adenosyltransferase, partial [Pirellulaceae bacterium]|nr:cob(I)yrinic acid a,c-diamide adenosyltransferase [Pirellulaceae bacterium]